MSLTANFINFIGTKVNLWGNFIFKRTFIFEEINQGQQITSIKEFTDRPTNKLNSTGYSVIAGISKKELFTKCRRIGSGNLCSLYRNHLVR